MAQNNPLFLIQRLKKVYTANPNGDSFRPPFVKDKYESKKSGIAGLNPNQYDKVAVDQKF